MATIIQKFSLNNYNFSVSGIKIESDLYTNTQSTSYKYLQYRIQSLVRAIIDETGSFVDYSNVTIVPGLLIITATIIYSDPDQMANFRNSLERIIETSGPFALGPDAVWDFRQDNNTIGKSSISFVSF